MASFLQYLLVLFCLIYFDMKKKIAILGSTGSIGKSLVNIIAKDLFDLMQPNWLEVHGDFMPRGGISIIPTARLEK